MEKFPAKKGRYICPCCNKDNLTFNRTNLSFSCYSSGCGDRSEIYKAMAVAVGKSDNWQKKTRIKQSREWVYTSIGTGKPLVKVVRIDSGNETDKPTRWQENLLNGAKTLEGIDSSDIALYRWDLVQQAIANKQPVFFVEGEPAADSLISLGLTATTNLRGTSGWQKLYAEQLKDAEVIICPDRDEPGVKFAKKVQSDLLSVGVKVRWLYAFPSSGFWYNLPTSNGLDVFDWLEDESLTGDQVLQFVEDERDLEQNKKKGFGEKLEKQPLKDLDGLFEHIRELNLSWYQEKRRLQVIYGTYECPFQYRELEELYKAFKERKDSSLSIIDGISNANEFIKAKSKTFDIYKVLPKPLAEVIAAKAKANNSDTHRYYLQLLSFVATIVGSKVRLQTNRCIDEFDARWSEMIFHIIDISGSSNGKTDAFEAVFRPLIDMDNKYMKEQEQIQKKYETVKETWDSLPRKDKTDNMENPEVNPRLFREKYLVERQFVLKKGSIEGIFKEVAKQAPKRGVQLFVDEFARVYSFDQYKVKGGDSQEKLLESWNAPFQGKDIRVDEKGTVFYNGQTLNLSGGMQPALVSKYLDVVNDHQGRLARILFTVNEYPEEYKAADLTISCYKTINELANSLMAIPERDVRMNNDAFALYQKFDIKTKNEGYRLGRTKENNGLSSYLLKAAQQSSRIALAHHILLYIFGLTKELSILDEQAIVAALYVMDFQIAQFRIVQSLGKINEGTEDLIIKIINKAKELGNQITTSQVFAAYRRHKIDDKPINTEMILSIFEIIENNGLGTISEKTLILTTQKPDPEPDLNTKTEGGDELTDELKEILEISDNSSAKQFVNKYSPNHWKQFDSAIEPIPHNSVYSELIKQAIAHIEGIENET